MMTEIVWKPGRTTHGTQIVEHGTVVQEKMSISSIIRITDA